MERDPPNLQDDDDHVEPEPEVSRTRKRRRTIQACEECRDRKRKCDGKRPVCGSCSRRPGRCIWNDDRNTKGWSNNYVESLQSRIIELESAQALAASASEVPENEQLVQSQEARDASINVNSSANAVPDIASHAAPEPSAGHPQPTSASPLSPSAFIPPPRGPVQQPRQGQARPTTSQRPNCTENQDQSSVAADDSHDESSADENFDAIGSDAFVDGLDAMGVVHSATDGAPGRPRRPSGYFGPSSAVSLLGDAFSAIKQRAHRHDTSSSGSWDSGAADLHDGAFNVHTSGSRGHQYNTPPVRDDCRERTGSGGIDYVMPTRAKADELVDSYWRWVHSLYPFPHMPSFLARYRTLWQPARNKQGDSGEAPSPTPTNYYNGVSDKLFHCMLNAVFAMGALFNPVVALQGRDAVSRTFFNRAKALVDLDELACGSIALVQVLLLMGQYLQSTDAASSCWNIVGLATRVSQGIGLHHEPECCRSTVCVAGHHSQLDREIRRRTWTCAIILDRVLALTYGRPMMIHPAMTRNRICLPQDIDEEYLTGPGQEPGQQPPGTISLMGCYIEAVRLQDIIGRFLAPINHVGFEYEQDAKTRDYSTSKWYEKEDLDLKTIFEIDKLLDDWLRKLPVHLRFQTYREGQGPNLNQNERRLPLLERQANVLTARFLHARLTLFRPALTVLCNAPCEEDEDVRRDETSFSSINKEMVIKAANLCLSAANALVDVMTTNMDASADRLPAPWYNVFYIHSCAIVLILGYLCPPSYITCMDKTSLTDAYNRSITFLRANRAASRSARRCSKVLTAIQHQVFRPHDASESNNGPQERGNTTEEWRPDVFQADATELEPMMPLCDPAQIQDMMAPSFLNGETPSQTNLGRTGDAYDMTWLSLVPFWGDSEQITLN